MVLMLDRMSERYHCLPSQALRNANTLDVFILTRALEYYDRQRNPDKYANKSSNLSEEQLWAIVNSKKRTK
jgi:hypothetical protein